MTLSGKTAIVTGGTRGIGKGVAVAMAKAGANVVVTSRTLADVERVAAELESLGASAFPVTVDVSDEKSVDEMIQKTLDKYGRLDILVNNAGILLSSLPTVETPLEHWKKMIDTNLTSVFICCKAAAKVMIAQGGGKIINMSSVNAHVAAPRGAAYNATKGGVNSMTRVFALEWGPYNINVNTISPGAMNTEMTMATRAKNPEIWQRRDARVPIKRLASPADTGNVAVFLASDEGSYINGQDIVVDGGLMCWDAGIVNP